MDCSPRGSSVHGILQARILEWKLRASILMHNIVHKKWAYGWFMLMYGRNQHNIVIILLLKLNKNFYMGLSTYIYQKPTQSKRLLYEVKWSCSIVSDSLWPHGLYIAYQAPLSMGFSRQEYFSGLSFPSPGDHPNPGIEKGCYISIQSIVLIDFYCRLSQYYLGFFKMRKQRKAKELRGAEKGY